MRSFEYARPETEDEALELLSEQPDAAVLAGGTDAINLFRDDLLAPSRVVDLKTVPSLSGVEETADGLIVGALTTLEEVLDHPAFEAYRSLRDSADNVRSIQVQSMGTLGGDLCHLPNCWYFRNGYGLLGLKDGKSLPAAGENRYHAILGNRGPAKFVSASRFAPAMIAWQAQVRIVGPQPGREQLVPLEKFFVTPKTDRQGVTVLKPGQFISHLLLPRAERSVSATYEVSELEGLDWPLASAAATVTLDGGLVREARLVLGHVAPTPWVAKEAASSLAGHRLTESTAAKAAALAVKDATPLSGNDYKVQIAQTCAKRALLRAIGEWESSLN